MTSHPCEPQGLLVSQVPGKTLREEQSEDLVLPSTVEAELLALQLFVDLDRV